jgi:hypothetical protein
MLATPHAMMMMLVRWLLMTTSGTVSLCGSLAAIGKSPPGLVDRANQPMASRQAGSPHGRTPIRRAK